MPAAPPTSSAGLLGVVAVRADDQLARADLRGEPLFIHACRTLVDSRLCSRIVVVTDYAGLVGVQLDSAHLDAPAVAEGDLLALLARQTPGNLVLVHDPRCPLTSVEDVQAAVSGGGAPPRVGARSVTDTIKSVSDDRSLVTGTVNREAYQQICGPLVAPAALLERLQRERAVGSLLGSLPELVRSLAAMTPVGVVAVSTAAARVHDLDELAVLRARGSTDL